MLFLESLRNSFTKNSPSVYPSLLKKILKNYADEFETLIKLPEPDTESNDALFMEALRNMNAWHQSNLALINQGLRELSNAVENNDPKIVPKYLLPNGEPRLQDASKPAICSSGTIKWLENQERTSQVEHDALNQATFWNNNPNFFYAVNRTSKFFEWFYSMCLGTQVLVQGQICTRDFGKTYVRKFHPVDVAKIAVADARTVAAKHYGVEPPVVEIVTADPDLSTVYIPYFLYSIIFELMKNAFRATIEFHRKNNSDPPPVKLVIAKGLEDLTFKVSDQGGGMPYSKVQNLWSFLHQRSRNEGPENFAYPSHPLEKFESKSSASKNPNPDSGSPSSKSYLNEFNEHILSDSPLYGYGIGLPTLRMIARFFGGDLDVVSMEGYGTDFYLHLHRSGNVLECTPDISELSIESALSSVSDLVSSLNEIENSQQSVSA
ncbi:hypothetical protein BB560_002282 [Smittium megazygosporum]|uniref:Protein-serine/threonine kinase n=1 Tax=Smittium megazygosporum TaxID=133381 RepID=A0A2T9ZF66_9FUNG|nr:hypothetical protein BB560_002282 [Smittium megazygosporum]